MIGRKKRRYLSSHATEIVQEFWKLKEQTGKKMTIANGLDYLWNVQPVIFPVVGIILYLMIMQIGKVKMEMHFVKMMSFFLELALESLS